MLKSPLLQPLLKKSVSFRPTCLLAEHLPTTNHLPFANSPTLEGLLGTHLGANGVSSQREDNCLKKICQLVTS